MTKWTHFRRVWLLPIVAICAGSTPRDAGAQLVAKYVDERYHGRVLVVTLGSNRYAMEQLVALVARPGAGGAPAIGLAHSGYSGLDLDEKSVLLTLTIQLISQTLSEPEKQSLKSEGISFAPDVLSLSKPTMVELDVVLPSDPVEEQRLRRELQLPKAVSSTASMTFQVRWKNVPGKTLYSWLTEQSGLHFRVSYSAPVSWRSTRAPMLPTGTVATWWTARFGNSVPFRRRRFAFRSRGRRSRCRR